MCIDKSNVFIRYVMSMYTNVIYIYILTIYINYCCFYLLYASEGMMAYTSHDHPQWFDVGSNFEGPHRCNTHNMIYAYYPASPSDGTPLHW